MRTDGKPSPVSILAPEKPVPVLIDRRMVVDRLSEVFQSLSGSNAVIVALHESVNGLLTEENDIQLRREIVGQAVVFFKSEVGKAPAARAAFCTDVIRTILARRPAISALRLASHHKIVTELARLDQLPLHLRSLNPTRITAPPPPKAVVVGDFDKLLPAAIEMRIRSVMEFFHRRNPDVEREIPPPDILTADFCDTLVAAIGELVVPLFADDRRLRIAASSRQWDVVNTHDFWRILVETGEIASVHRVWNDTWRLVSRARFGSAIGIPELGDIEIGLFQSLLGPTFSRQVLENAWTRVRQIYEQEMDPRIYQDRAREGALRDAMLDALDALPDRHGELMILTSYYTFPRLTTRFLASFARNKGCAERQRRVRIPFLMAFLDDPAVPVVMAVEDRRIEEERVAAEARRGKGAAPSRPVRWDTAATPAQAPGGGVAWGNVREASRNTASRPMQARKPQRSAHGAGPFWHG